MSESNLRLFYNSLNLPDKLIITSCHIRQRMLINVKKLLPIAFYCLYYAHVELNIPVIYIDIAYLININIKSVPKILSTFSAHKTGYTPPVFDLTIYHAIHYYYKRLKNEFPDLSYSFSKINKLNSFYNDIINLLNSTNNNIIDRKPHIIAASIIIIFYNFSNFDWSLFFHYNIKILNPLINQLRKLTP